MDGSEDTGILVGDKSNLEGLEQLTVAAWVKTSNPSGNRSIVAKHFREDPPPSYILRTYHDDNSGRVSFGVKTGSSGRLLSNEIISSKTIADGQFHFVVGTYDGAEMKLYVDGEAEASKSLSGIIQDSEYPVVIGNAGTAQGEIAPRPSFDGLIDDVRIYDRALSTNEVQALFEDSGGDAVLQSR
jgi:beta-galactosidase